MDVKWNKCQGDTWCNFNGLNLSNPIFDNSTGVYIIWSNKITVKIGSGHIREELTNDRLNNTISAYQNICVTWCLVEPFNVNSVKKYLADRLKPVIPIEIINDSPKEVNLPWS